MMKLWFICILFEKCKQITSVEATKCSKFIYQLLSTIINVCVYINNS